MLACILGCPSEVFFPKLGENQMLTFSSICDDFIRAEGFDKKECSSDTEAKAYAAEMSFQAVFEPVNGQSRVLYPVVYFNSDTTGEKAYEEFYVPGEELDMTRFQSLGVVKQNRSHTMEEVNEFFTQLEAIFTKDDFTKSEVVDAIKDFIPNFAHEEKGKNLDSKM